MFTWNKGVRPPSSGWSPYTWRLADAFEHGTYVALSDSCSTIAISSLRLGVTSSGPDANPRAVGLRVDDVDLMVELADGRRVSVPLTWFPRLLHASAAELANWHFVGEGEGVHWPDIDEDLSVKGLLQGADGSDGKRAG